MFLHAEPQIFGRLLLTLILLISPCAALAELSPSMFLSPLTSAKPRASALLDLLEAAPEGAVGAHDASLAEGRVATRPILTNGLVRDQETGLERRRHVVLPQGAHLVVLGREVVPGVGSMLRLGVDLFADTATQEQVESVPSDILVRADAYEGFPLAGEETVYDGGAPELEEALADYVYLPAREASNKKSARRAKSRVKRRRSRMTYCYRNVKKYLLKAGMVKKYLPGSSAYMAAKTLPKHGFKRLHVDHPKDAEKGAVCVYKSSRKQRHGHIEVKKDKGCWWYGYGCKAKSMYGKRPFYDCFTKA